jgi:hypothetical protein
MVLSDVLRCVLYYIVYPCWFWPWYFLVIQNTPKNVRQCHGQNQQGQSMLYKTHRRTSDTTMPKTKKDNQCYSKHIGSSMCFVLHCLSLLVLAIVLSDVLRCVLHTIVYPCWFWPWYCLTFFDVFCITLFALTMLYKTHRRTSDNTMAKTDKDKQCYTKHIEERQTIPWTKPTRTNNGIQNTSTLFVLVRFGHGIVWRSSMCFVLHCLSLLALSMELSDVLRCALYNIVCPCRF